MPNLALSCAVQSFCSDVVANMMLVFGSAMKSSVTEAEIIETALEYWNLTNAENNSHQEPTHMKV